MSGIPEDAQFMVRLMSAMHTNTTATVDSLWRSAVRDERFNEAALIVVRENVSALLNAPFMAHPHTIESALYPPNREVEAMAVYLYGDDWANPESARRPNCCF